MSSAEDQKEYWQHVSPQEEIPVWGEIKLPNFKEFNDIINKLNNNIVKNHKNIIEDALLKNPKIFNILRLFVGIANKRAYLDLSYIFRNTSSPNGKTSLCGCNKTEMSAHQMSFFLNSVKNGNNKMKKIASKKISEYLFERGLLEILGILSRLNVKQRTLLIEKTIFPREIQQKQAKRRGHGAEAILAKVVKELGCKITPPKKDVNPMGQRDVRLDKKIFSITTKNNASSRSYDLVISDKADVIRILMAGLIHSSDPGQFGVDKTKDTIQGKKEIELYNKGRNDNKKIMLGALVDGVGFAENKKDTINKILENVDVFVQVKTLYKIGLLLHKLKLCKIKAIMFDTKFYSIQDIKKIKEKYIQNDIVIITDKSKINANWKKIEAGLGTLFI